MTFCCLPADDNHQRVPLTFANKHRLVDYAVALISSAWRVRGVT